MQGEQPRDTLTHTFEKRLVKIFGFGQTREFRIVVAEFFVYDFGYVRLRDNADKFVVCVQYGDGVFFVIF